MDFHMNFGHPEPISQGQSLALEPIDLRANGGLHRANFSKLALHTRLHVQKNFLGLNPQSAYMMQLKFFQIHEKKWLPTLKWYKTIFVWKEFL